MKQKKLCCIFNINPLHRLPIYKKIDAVFDCSWVFGYPNEKENNIRTFALSDLKNAIMLKTISFKKAYWQIGMINILFKNYDRYIILGDPACLNTWFFVFLAMFMPKKKVYFWTHGWYGKEGLLKRIVKKIYFKMADGVLPYGDYARNLMIKEGFSPDKIWAIHNSLNHEVQLKIRATLTEEPIFKNIFNNDYKNLIFIGRLTKVKNLDLILKAMKILKDRSINLNFTLIGKGSEQEHLQSIAKELNLDKNIYFVGECFDDSISAKYIYNADLCISPGNVGLTAMSVLVFGCPVITHGDFKYQMPEFEAIKAGKTGDFFEHNNPDSLAEKIENWLNSNKDRNEIRKLAYEEIDNFWNPDYQIEVLKNSVMKD